MDLLSNEVENYSKNNKEVPENVIKDIQRCLSTPRQELADMEAKIEELAEQWIQLDQRRSQLQEHVSRYDCVLSPIRRIPTDVLHNIFFHCLPTRRDPIISVREAPLLLTRICRVWRQTAYTSPSLWAKIYITFSDEDSLADSEISYGSTRQYLSNILRLRCSAVEQWLSRSGVCPLSISVYYTSNIWQSTTDIFPGNSENTLSLFSILARFSSRWQKLQLKMPIEVYRLLETMVPVSQLSALTTFKASFSCQTEWGDLPPEVQSDVTFFDAPNLATLTLTLPKLWKRFRSISSISSANLTMLTNLSFNCRITASQAISLLKTCPNLEYLVLDLKDDIIHTATPFAPQQYMISLPRLRSISITDSIRRPTDAIGFYGCIDAPHLEWIDYLNRLASDEPIHDIPFVRLLKKSPELKKLTIEADKSTSQELRVILESAPSVTHLAFGTEMRRLTNSLLNPSSIRLDSTKWNFGEVFLCQDTSVKNDSDGEYIGCDPTSTLLPNLEILEVYKAATTRLKDKTLLDIILSRLDPKYPIKKLLKTVAVIFNRPKEIDISNEVMTHSKHQIKLDIHYSDVRPPYDQYFVSPGYGVASCLSYHWQDLAEEMNSQWAIELEGIQ